MKAERYYRMPEVQHVGTEEPRAYYVPFDRSGASEGSRENSPFFTSLNGEWDFRFFKNEEELEPDAPDFPGSVACNASVRVPG